MVTNDRTHALILSGGGAYGAYEVGVMKALFGGVSQVTDYASLDARVFAGTSVGSLNAAFMSMQPDRESSSTVQDLESIWVNMIADGPQTCGNGVYRVRMNPFEYLQPGCFAPNPMDPLITGAKDVVFLAQDWLKRVASFPYFSERLFQKALQLIDLSAFISIDPLRQNIKKIIHFDGIRRSNRLLRISASNWDSGEVKIFENKDMTEETGALILQGSSAIPGIFPPVDISGTKYVDAGVVMNTPLNPAISAGADVLYVIYLDPDIRKVPLLGVMGTAATISRMFVIQFAATMNRDIEIAIRINRGVDFLERATRPPFSQADLKPLALTVGRPSADSKYKKLTIHRYHPHDELGDPFGMLDFRQQTIIRIIERGFKDAAEHDCEASQCIIP